MRLWGWLAGLVLLGAGMAQAAPSARELYFQAVELQRGLGAEENPAKAAELFQAAAERGFVKAQTALGVMFDRGKGIPRDDAAAERWYRRAAEQGDAEAEYRLGAFYQLGRAVAVDKVEAWKWFDLAELAGYGDGLSARLEIAEQLSAMELAEAERRARAFRAKPEPQR